MSLWLVLYIVAAGGFAFAAVALMVGRSGEMANKASLLPALLVAFTSGVFATLAMSALIAH